MSVIEDLVKARHAGAEKVFPVAAQLFRSQVTVEDIYTKYREEASAIYNMVGVLLAGRSVIMSGLYAPLLRGGTGYGQVDVYRPIVLSSAGAAEPLNCYPFKDFDSVLDIKGKREEIQRTKRILPISSQAHRTWDTENDTPLMEARYGFALTPDDPITLINEGRSRMTISPNERTFILSGTNPRNPIMKRDQVVNEAHFESQALFGAFVEELLVHEGHEPVQVTVWR